MDPGSPEDEDGGDEDDARHTRFFEARGSIKFYSILFILFCYR